ncbi:hypothetical protein SDC9_154987 [bioreactor metagenome]|uniref:Uncharacterized protein n=1 Tax=bioreactor metagenome TaxID=1076179 RepID=A0A645F229_9ZZZZ
MGKVVVAHLRFHTAQTGFYAAVYIIGVGQKVPERGRVLQHAEIVTDGLYKVIRHDIGIGENQHGRMQLFYALTFGLRQLEAKVKLRTERAEDTDCNGEERQGKQELSDNRAANRAENGQQPVDGRGHINLPNQSPPFPFQPCKSCEKRLPVEPHGSGLFPAPQLCGYLFIKTADKKNCRAHKQEHGKVSNMNRCHLSFTSGNRQ